MNAFWHLLVTMIILGTIFAYYLFEARMEKKPFPFVVYQIAALFFGLLAVATLGIALMMRSDLRAKQNAPRVIPSPAPQVQPTSFPVRDPYYPPVVDEPQWDLPEETQPKQPQSNLGENGEMILAKATNLPSRRESIGGIDFTVEDARVIKEGREMLLELDVVFGANSNCPTTGSGTCTPMVVRIQATDGDNFVLQRTNMMDLRVVADRPLQPGQKVKGKSFFVVSDVASVYNVTYKDGTEESGKIQINMKKN